jgi:pimeloyl-ACP methyl ester carboxylesterase
LAEGNRMKLAEKIFRADSISINYAEGPALGPPVILLHGVGSVLQDWQAVIERIQERCHLFAPDLRGCGGSSWAPQNYRLSDFAGDVIDMVQDLVTGPAALVGHSLGAMVAIQAAVGFPSLIRALVLEDPPLYMTEFAEEWVAYPYFPLAHQLALSRSPEKIAAERFAKELGVGAREARKLARSTVSIDPALLERFLDRSFFDELDSEHMDRMLAQISCPVLLIHGEFDRGSALRGRDLERAARFFRKVDFLPMPGLGHALHSEAPQLFSESVIRFLDSIRDHDRAG